MTIHDGKGLGKDYELIPASRDSGVIEFMNFSVGKKQRKWKFPFEIDSFEFGIPSGFKATFKKKKE